MNHPPTTEWLLANQQTLVAHLVAVRAALARHASDVPAAAAFATDDLPALPPMPATAPAALDTLSELLGLSPFERAIVVLCAGILAIVTTLILGVYLVRNSRLARASASDPASAELGGTVVEWKVPATAA